jgi:hypothetical protein
MTHWKRFDENKYELNLANQEHASALAFSFKKIYRSSSFSEDTNRLKVTANSLCSLKEYLHKKKLSYGLCIVMLEQLLEQLTILWNIGYGFCGFDLEQIVVLNETQFAFCESLCFLFPVDKFSENQNCILLYYPLRHLPFFYNPEIISLQSLPTRIPQQNIYFNLALLAIYAIRKKHVQSVEYSLEKWLEIIEPIKYTKLYWCLLRCLEEDINKRVFLLV